MELAAHIILAVLAWAVVWGIQNMRDEIAGYEETQRLLDESQEL